MRSLGMSRRAATSSRSGPSYTTGIRCRRPGSAMGGRLAARRLIAAPSTSSVVWSGSKCTVTLAYPAIACLTSRRFCSAAASAMARVLSAVSSREPSSARSAVSPSWWMRTRGERPCGHDRSGGDVPGREVLPHSADRGREVEQVERSAAECKAHDRVRYEHQQDQAPGQSQDEGGANQRVNVRQDSVADVPEVGTVQAVGKRIQGQDEGRGQEQEQQCGPETVRQEADRQLPWWGTLSGTCPGGSRRADRVPEHRDETEREDEQHQHPDRPARPPPALKGP